MIGRGALRPLAAKFTTKITLKPLSIMETIYILSIMILINLIVAAISKERRPVHLTSAAVFFILINVSWHLI